MAARRRNSPHPQPSPSQRREIPLLVGDYCSIKDIEGEESKTVLVCRLYPARALFAVVCESKGEDEFTIVQLAKFIKDSGYRKIIYRSDQEPAIRALFEATFIRSQREGECYNPHLEQFVPEASAVGESQSNGKAENAVQRLEDMVRTYKAALEGRLKCKIPIDSPIMDWMVLHATSVYNRHVCNEDGLTPYEVIHGQRLRARLVEFGEQVFYYIPKKARAKMNLRFRLGTFLGNAQNSNEVFIATRQGDVVRTRSIVRVVESSRWSTEAIKGVRGTPVQPKPSGAPTFDESIEKLDDPHLNADDVSAGDLQKELEKNPKRAKQLERQIRITATDLNNFGYTDHCPKCRDLQAGIFDTNAQHSTDCRLRIYLQYKESNHPKWKFVKHLFDDSDEKSFSKRSVDPEGFAPAEIPLAMPPESEMFVPTPTSGREDASHVHQSNESLGMDEEAIRAEEVDQMAMQQDNDEDKVAELFGDFDSDMEEEEEEKGDVHMMDALTQAGIIPEHAKEILASMRSGIPPATFIEVYGRSVRDQSLVTRRNLNVKGLDALDLRTTKPDGTAWDFRRSKDRQEARELIYRQRPQWLIGAPPCTAFSIWNYAMNYAKMDGDVVREKLEEGRLHLKFMCSLYRYQAKQGRYYLHEHPASALSWKEEEIDALASKPGSFVVVADQCMYGLVTPSQNDPDVKLPAMKPTNS